MGVQQLLAAAAAASNNPGKLVVVGKGTGIYSASICWRDTPVPRGILIVWTIAFFILFPAFKMKVLFFGVF